MHVHLTLGEAATFNVFAVPLTLGQGVPRRCFENARKEYWAWKERGASPEYWEGEVVGFGRDDASDAPIEHAWVMVGGMIADATPYESGGARYPAYEFWTPGVVYNGARRIGEDFLQTELISFVGPKGMVTEAVEGTGRWWR